MEAYRLPFIMHWISRGTVPLSARTAGEVNLGKMVSSISPIMTLMWERIMSCIQELRIRTITTIFTRVICAAG